MADEEEYERMVLVSNTNRDDSIIEAHSVDDALTKMTIAEPVLAPDRHPERRLKATFKVNFFFPLAVVFALDFDFSVGLERDKSNMVNPFGRMFVHNQYIYACLLWSSFFFLIFIFSVAVISPL